MELLGFDEPGSQTDPGSFAVRARQVFEAQPVHANVIATWLQQALAGWPVTVTRWFVIAEGGSAVAVAIHAPGRGVMISPLPEGFAQPVAELLASALRPWAAAVLSASGGVLETNAFAQAWERQQGGSWEVVMKEWVYVIGHPPAGPDVPGHGRLSITQDVDVLVPHLASFERETFGRNRSVASAQDDAVKTLARRPIYVWDAGGEIVSIAGLIGPAGETSRIGPVYTPPGYRRRGFGSAVTAFAARQAFDQGARRCMLYADQGNITSNSVYSNLGFRCAGDGQMLAFVPG